MNSSITFGARGVRRAAATSAVLALGIGGLAACAEKEGGDAEGGGGQQEEDGEAQAQPPASPHRFYPRRGSSARCARSAARVASRVVVATSMRARRARL